MSRRSIRSGRSGGPSRRRRNGRSLASGDTLRWMLALPARLGVRWLVILLITVAAMAAYGHILATAPPMPPSQVPGRTPTPGAAVAPTTTR